MKLKFLFLLPFAVLSLASCSTTWYYYSSVNSSDYEVEKENNGELVAETDSLLIGYSFGGYNMPINVSVYNKTEQPIFLDWSESAVIIEGTALEQPIPYEKSDLYLAESLREYYHEEFNLPNASHRSGQKPKEAMLIPPASGVNTTLFVSADLSSIGYREDSYFETKLQKRESGESKAFLREYTRNDSPLHIKSYLTFYTKDKKGERNDAFVEAHHFYVGQVIKTKIYPTKIDDYYINGEDLFFNFYLHGSNNSTVVLQGVGLGLIVAIVVAALVM